MGKPDRRAGSGKSVVHTSRAGFAYLSFFYATVRLISRFGLWARSKCLTGKALR